MLNDFLLFPFLFRRGDFVLEVLRVKEVQLILGDIVRVVPPVDRRADVPVFCPTDRPMV